MLFIQTNVYCTSCTYHVTLHSSTCFGAHRRYLQGVSCNERCTRYKGCIFGYRMLICNPEVKFILDNDCHKWGSISKMSNRKSWKVVDRIHLVQYCELCGPVWIGKWNSVFRYIWGISWQGIVTVCFLRRTCPPGNK
jgi:hypothetical protein